MGRLDLSKWRKRAATRFLDRASYRALFALGKDVAPVDVEVNTLTHPILHTYYQDKKWSEYIE